MVLLLNAVLYVVALSLSLAVLTPIPEGASPRVRSARRLLVSAGGLAMSVAIMLSFMGRWLESGIAGGVAIAIVGACLWLGLTSRFTPRGEDDADGQDGGGGPRKRPDPPAPPEPAGGPSADSWLDWSEFDRARAGWERGREPVGA
ncbi:MAG: hypothetical protein KY463_10615 [Actinobacteria bacterium]|nr:hypothetical protein [Actinomycetota bacterium]